MENQAPTFEEIRTILKDIAASQKEADSRIQEIEQRMEKVDRRIEILSMERLRSMYSDDSFADEYFSDAYINNNLIFAGMYFYYMKKDLKMVDLKREKRDELFDMVLYNDTCIAIIRQRGGKTIVNDKNLIAY